MNLPLFIARRYLFSRKSHSAINIISMVSLVGVALATAALVCVLSVFNGFHDLVASFFTDFDPVLVVRPAEGKTFRLDAPELQRLRSHDKVEAACATLENHALARYNGLQAMVVLKGVEDNFDSCTHVSRILYGDGHFVLHADVLNYAIPGIRLAMSLGLGAHFTDPLEIFTPRPGERVNMMDPSTSFNQDELHSAGCVFNVNQKRYDNEYIICPLAFAQRMFEKPGQASALELSLTPGTDVGQAKRELRDIAGPRFCVLDRYEQQADVFRIMKVEKAMAFIFLVFILVIACFNIVASLSMLIIDKRRDITTLHNIGASPAVIRRIFLMEGRLISIAGAVIGLVVGLGLCWAQIEFGLIKLGEQSGTFIVDAYPVSIHATDVLLIFVTVVVVTFLSSWYPVRYLSRRLFTEKLDS